MARDSRFRMYFGLVSSKEITKPFTKPLSNPFRASLQGAMLSFTGLEIELFASKRELLHQGILLQSTATFIAAWHEH